MAKSKKQSRKSKANEDDWPEAETVAPAQPPTSLLARRRSSVSKPPTKPKTKRQKSLSQIDRLAATLESNNALMPPTKPLPLLICSIGNPGTTYANTLHSAGHTVLNRLASHLNYPAFRKEKSWGNGLLSQGGEWTLWQSTAYMNESGKGVRAAYTAWNKSLGVGEQGRLVIVHDELEKELGSLSVKTKQGLSARGHNGLKSILAHLGVAEFVRVGVGIGRPVSRESADVARYVLRKMTEGERERVEGCVGELVERLRGLEGG
ncbi:hypothetical protein PRZ48_007440 [Zasmidium cellare]|uniref:peptidyl-tRNA hydrolase n=1 Tax=Zasmidium cellare TaxID=395010 RepID=A0ABR0EJC3_ZASCE|nr:hypothetical protein PRZ48_007440 [Zasmidium cellare]